MKRNKHRQCQFTVSSSQNEGSEPAGGFLEEKSLCFRSRSGGLLRWSDV